MVLDGHQIIRTERGWLHDMAVKRPQAAQPAPTPSRQIQFTDCDVRFVCFGDFFRAHQREMVDWINDRKIPVKAYMFMPDIYGGTDLVIYRFAPTHQSEAANFKLFFSEGLV